MAIRMTKPWVPLTAENVKKLPGQLGVFQLADAKGNVVFIGFAGGRSLFGVRSEIEKLIADPPSDATQFRVEINQQYTTRYQELLMLHVHDTGAVPAGNVGKPLPRLGRLSPL
ncbi:MAG: hypothetical protein JSS20_18995 [Proteobacteria bacterium]|nr:hypothetical protein [Pseudomonadota bacterium]